MLRGGHVHEELTSRPKCTNGPQERPFPRPFFPVARAASGTSSYTYGGESCHSFKRLFMHTQSRSSFLFQLNSSHCD